MAGTIKTDQERTLPLPDFVRDRLAEHLAGRAAQVGRALSPEDYVFVGVKGGLRPDEEVLVTGDAVPDRVARISGRAGAVLEFDQTLATAS